MSTLIPQIPPPLDLEEPPEDATKTASGLAFKKLTERDSGAQLQRSDTVLVHYTGWRQSTGDTFFTTKGNSQPMELNIAHLSPGFGEALQRFRKGEKVVVWVPPSSGSAETLVYEVELVDVIPPSKVATQGTAAASQPQSR